MTCFALDGKNRDFFKRLFGIIKMNVFAVIWYYIPVEMKLMRHDSMQ